MPIVCPSPIRPSRAIRVWTSLVYSVVSHPSALSSAARLSSAQLCRCCSCLRVTPRVSSSPEVLHHACSRSQKGARWWSRHQGQEEGSDLHHRLRQARRGQDHGHRLLREVPPRPHQGRWQGRSARQRRLHLSRQEQDQRHLRELLLQEILEVLDEEVLEEAQREGLAPSDCVQQGQECV